jgi:hypothetical protein
VGILIGDLVLDFFRHWTLVIRHFRESWVDRDPCGWGEASKHDGV